MKLLFVCTLPPHPGGSAEFNAQLVNGLASRGHLCRTISPITESAKEYDQHHPGAFPGVVVSRYIVPHFELWQPYFFDDISSDYRAAERCVLGPLLSAAIVADRPDAIVIGRESFVEHVIGCEVRNGIPTVLVPHLGKLPSSLLAKEFPEKPAEVFMKNLRQVTRIIAIADHLTPVWKQLGLENVRTIRNQVDGELFSPRAKDPQRMQTLDIAPDDIVVAHVSNLKPVKRIGDLVASAVLALQRNPKLLYLIVGDGPEHRAIVQACARHEVAPRFRFVGWTPRRQVADYLNLADMVAMPSESEGRSLALMEAQACGKVVVASDIPANRELIRHGETGVLFPVGAVAELADVTLRLAGDPQLRTRLGARALRESRSGSLATMVKQYEDVLHELTHLNA